MKANKRCAKFEIRDLLPIALTVVVASIGIAYGMQVMADIRADTCTYGLDATANTCKNSTGGTGAVELSAEFNATTQGLLAVGKFPAKMGMIVTVIIAAIIIGILVKYLMFQ
jgi:hypothetical protein